MTLAERLPASILGGDPFNQFRFLYRRELLWKLFDEEYALSVMKAYFEAGGRAYDLSFEENTRPFSRLKEWAAEPLIGFGNPSWEQGVFLNGRYLQYSRDRILRTLVDRLFPRPIARLVEEKLSKDDVLVFGYDRSVKPLTDEEIANISLNEEAFFRRLSIFEDCQYILLGGSDADWLVSLGRLDLVAEMAARVRQKGWIPLLLCQYASLVVPAAEEYGLEVEGYAVPLNREWSWFDRDACLEAIKNVKKPVIAFMPLAGGGLRKDVRGALDWLFCEAGVESVLFGTATPEHAAHTAQVARAARDASGRVISQR